MSSSEPALASDDLAADKQDDTLADTTESSTVEDASENAQDEENERDVNGDASKGSSKNLTSNSTDSSTSKTYSFREAAIAVLREAGRPLSAKDITQQAIERNMISTTGKTPDRTVAALMYSEMKQRGRQSAFCLSARGVFGLTEFSPDQRKNIVGTSSGYSDDKSKKKRKKKQSSPAPSKKRKVTTTKRKKTAAKDSDSDDSEKTESEDENELSSKPQSNKSNNHASDKSSHQTRSFSTTTTTTTSSSSATPTTPRTTRTVVTPIRMSKRTGKGNGGASAGEEDGYNDDYGYMYLRYFLDLTRRQEENDYSPEDDCFICKNGGDLCCCDFPCCPKVYHMNCLGIDKIPEGKWYCPWHSCAVCAAEGKNGKAAVYNCATCTNAYCEEHLPPKDKIKMIRKEYIVCARCMPYYLEELEAE